MINVSKSLKVVAEIFSLNRELSENDAQRLRLCPVRDFGERHYQPTQNLMRVILLKNHWNPYWV